MFNLLPRELMLVIAQHLDYACYWAWTCTNTCTYIALTSETTLRTYLREHDSTLTRTDLLRLLTHMSTHCYLLLNQDKVEKVIDHHRIPHQHSARGVISHDCYHRGFHYQKFVAEHIHTAVHSCVNEQIAFLHCNGDISVEIEGVCKRHPVQATELLGYFEAGVYYRNREGDYGLLSNSGTWELISSIPRAREVQQIYYNSSAGYLRILYLLRNRELYKVRGDGTCYRWRMPLDLVLRGKGIRKFLPIVGLSGWVLSNDNRVYATDGEGKVMYWCALTEVTDIVMDHMLYLLVCNKVFTHSCFDYKNPPILIYEGDTPFRTISVYGPHTKVTVVLGH